MPPARDMVLLVPGTWYIVLPVTPVLLPVLLPVFPVLLLSVLLPVQHS